ncbi:MAG: 30S ribosomal protein S12 methylthiotransferase RimO [Candidatus Methylacidiphilales bacterium]
MIKVGLISLGCAKNLIDSEIMAGHLQQAGMGLTPEASKADVLIVNTCFFIDAAKAESIEAILKANEDRGLKKTRKGQKLIVAGCMAQRFASELQQSLPEVDAFIGLDQITKIAPIISEVLGPESAAKKAAKATAQPSTPVTTPVFGDAGVTERPWVNLAPTVGNAPLPLPGTRPAGVAGASGSVNYVTEKPVYIPDYDTPRFRLTPSHMAYVKIAEGCNHPCSFCVIPRMRGKHRSRTVESVVREARQLIAEGVKELNLISQDTTYFGMDTWEGKTGPRQLVDSSRGDSLCTLIKELNAIEGDFWIRLLYTHPAHWSDELIETIAACPKVVRYIDMPLQHISDNMLNLMRRETSRQHIVDLIARMRAGIPDLALRTTFIVGFPGETEEDFDILMDFIRDTRFERMGVFKYSQEEGSRAAKMEGHLHHRTKQSRWERAMKLQKEVARSVSKGFLGQTVRVLVDRPGVARSYADAPDIDGRVLVDTSLPVGSFIDVNVRGTTDYDLIARG